MNAVAKSLQSEYAVLWSTEEIGSLVERCYKPDARLHSFGFRATGSAEIADVLARAAQRQSGMGAGQTVLSIQGEDFVWQETFFPDSPDDTSVYDFMFLHDGKIRLHLVGDKRGTVWLSETMAGQTPEKLPDAEALHHRYIELQSNGDADAMANGFFSEDARLITAKLNLEGREALRGFFSHKFENESDFHLVSMRNLTGDADYVWFEATAGSSAGSRTVYDVMLLQDDEVNLQLVGTLDGVLPANRNA